MPSKPSVLPLSMHLRIQSRFLGTIPYVVSVTATLGGRRYELWLVEAACQDDLCIETTAIRCCKWTPAHQEVCRSKEILWYLQPVCEVTWGAWSANRPTLPERNWVYWSRFPHVDRRSAMITCCRLALPVLMRNTSPCTCTFADESNLRVASVLQSKRR